MRIIAGIARSVPLITPEGFETRPTSDKVKETLFNMLQGYIEGTTFLDLFAGGCELRDRRCRCGLGGLPAGIGVYFGVEDQNVDIFAGG